MINQNFFLNTLLLNLDTIVIVMHDKNISQYSNNNFFFDPLGQFEVLNFISIDFNFFKKIIEEILSMFKLVTITNLIAYNQLNDVKIFWVIHDIINILVKEKNYDNLNGFLNEDLWLKLSIYSNVIANAKNNILFIDQNISNFMLHFKFKVYKNSLEINELYNFVAFKLFLFDIFFKNNILKSNLQNSIDKYVTFSNIYKERNSINIDYASYLFEIKNSYLFFEKQDSSHFLNRLGFTLNQYVNILFSETNNGSQISETEALFTIGYNAYCQYMKEYYKNLEYLWKMFSYYQTTWDYRQRISELDKYYDVWDLVPSLLNKMLKNENSRRVLNTVLELYNYNLDVDNLFTAAYMGHRRTTMLTYGTPYILYLAKEFNDTVDFESFSNMFKNRLYDIFVVENYKHIEYHTYLGSIFNDTAFTFLKKDINFNISQFIKCAKLGTFNSSEVKKSLYDLSPLVDYSTKRVYQLFAELSSMNFRDVDITFSIFSTYCVTEKGQFSGFKDWTKYRLLPLQRLVMQNDSDFRSWILSVAYHSFLNTNTLDWGYTYIRPKFPSYQVDKTIFQNNIQQKIFIYDYTTNMCFNNLYSIYKENASTKNQEITELLLKFITYLTRGVIFNEKPWILTNFEKLWLDKVFVEGDLVEKHLEFLFQYLNDYQKKNTGLESPFFTSVNDMIAYFLTSNYEGTSIFKHDFNLKKNPEVLDVFIQTMEKIWNIVIANAKLYRKPTLAVDGGVLANVRYFDEDRRDLLFPAILDTYVECDNPRLIGAVDSFFSYIFTKIYALPNIAPVDFSSVMPFIVKKNSEKIEAETFLNIIVSNKKVIDTIIHNYGNAIKSDNMSKNITILNNDIITYFCREISGYSSDKINAILLKFNSFKLTSLVSLDIFTIMDSLIFMTAIPYILSNTPINILSQTFVANINIFNDIFEIFKVIFFNNQNIIISYCILISILSFFILPVIKNIKLIPNNWQIFLETLYKFIINILEAQVGKIAQKFFPYVFSIFLIILIANIAGMTLYSFTLTSHILVTFTLGVSSFLGLTILGFFLQKLAFFNLFIPKGIPKALIPILLIVEIISYVSRALSLSIRLFANLMSGHTLLHILAFFSSKLFKYKYIIGLLSFLLILAIVVLEFCIAILQAYVFTILICIYLNDSFNASH